MTCKRKPVFLFDSSNGINVIVLFYIVLLW